MTPSESGCLQGPHLLVSSSWGLGLQHMDFGGDTDIPGLPLRTRPPCCEKPKCVERPGVGTSVTAPAGAPAASHVSESAQGPGSRGTWHSYRSVSGDAASTLEGDNDLLLGATEFWVRSFLHGQWLSHHGRAFLPQPQTQQLRFKHHLHPANCMLLPGRWPLSTRCQPAPALQDLRGTPLPAFRLPPARAHPAASPAFTGHVHTLLRTCARPPLRVHALLPGPPRPRAFLQHLPRSGHAQPLLSGSLLRSGPLQLEQSASTPLLTFMPAGPKARFGARGLLYFVHSRGAPDRSSLWTPQTSHSPHHSRARPWPASTHPPAGTSVSSCMSSAAYARPRGHTSFQAPCAC